METYLTDSQIDSTIFKIDTLLEQGKLTKYSFPDMSACGGGLFGHYLDTTLLKIDATFYAELGYSRRIFYWNKNKILKIIYQEHFAEWGKYNENYPPETHEWDTSRMTYTDTVYNIILRQKHDFMKLAGDSLVSSIMDSTLVDRLLNCGFEMKNELNTERKLEINIGR